jgi:hypothetical protein
MDAPPTRASGKLKTKMAAKCETGSLSHRHPERDVLGDAIKGHRRK